MIGYIRRNLEQRVQRLMGMFPCVVIRGVRQCGKTSMARQLCPDWPYFDLENPAHFERIAADPRFFLDQYPDGLVLDEVQELPSLFKALRGAIDDGPRRPARFLLTGSSSPELAHRAAETLAGRSAIAELAPLKANEVAEQPLPRLYALIASQAEAAAYASLTPTLTPRQIELAWLRGGYPEPTSAHDPEHHRVWMQEYRRLYVDRDIRRLFPRLDIVRYRRFVTMLAGLSGTIVNRAQLAASVEVSEPTIKDYLEIAHGSFVWRSLPSFEHNVTKAVTKMPRGHFRDSGFLNHLLRVDDLEALRQHPAAGRLFESFVIEEIVRGVEAASTTDCTPHYYRTRNRAEIDLVLDGPTGVLPVECKLGLQTDGRRVRTLHTFVEDHNLPLGLLVNWSTETTWLTPKVLQLPVGAI